MKKVYQTIVDKYKGNCMQAAVASLMDLDLDRVPDFLSFGEDWNKVWDDFWKGMGYTDHLTTIHKEGHDTELLKRVAKFDRGVDGYFYAVVPSQTYEDVQHAVVVDSDLNIVHDPNPNGKALLLKPEDVISILTMTEFIIGKTGKIFTIEEWDNATEEEKYLNTHRQNEE